MTRQGFIRFGWITLALTIVVIVWGAVVRATGSGAGCGSHWPLCNGVAVPSAMKTPTIIEFVHRMTSGVVMLLALGLAVLARRVFPAGHPARSWALASFVFMLVEAGIGAGLVLLGLVENNTSALRAGYITVHLVNTMLLVATITGTLWWAGQDAGVKRRDRSRGILIVLFMLIAVAATGAVVALGDTLFPQPSLAAGFSADLDPTAHFLIRLRVFHPALAVAAALVLVATLRRDPSFQHDGGAERRSFVTSLLMAQVAIGLFNLLMLAPLPLQLLHLVGSNVLWTAVVWSWMESAGEIYDTTR